MKALILADSHAAELQPLSLTVPPLMTQLGGRSIGGAMLESLAASRVDEVVIASSRFDRRLEDHLGSGERFGVSIGYMLRNRAESWLGTLQRLHEQCGFCTKQVLVIEGAVYSDFDARAGLAEHLHAGTQTTDVVQPDGAQLGMRFVEPISVESGDSGSSGEYRLERPAIRIDSFGEYFSRSLQAVAGGLPPFAPPQQQRAAGVFGATGVVADWDRVEVDGPVVIGSMTEIAPDVRLIGPVIIGRNCVIEAGCTIESSIVESQTLVQCGSQLIKTYAGGRGRWTSLGEPIVDAMAQTTWADQPVRTAGDKKDIAPDLAALATRVSMNF